MSTASHRREQEPPAALDEGPDAEARRLRDQDEREAADWIVRLSDPGLSAGRREALREERARWLAARPGRAEAYGEVDRVWWLLRRAAVAAGTLGTPEPAPGPGATAGAPAAAAERRALRQDRPAGRWRPLLLGGLASLALLAVAVGGALLLGTAPGLPEGADYATGPGEIREIVLADGSRVTLGSRSAIAIEAPAGDADDLREADAGETNAGEADAGGPDAGGTRSESAAARLRLIEGDAAFAAGPDRPADEPLVVEAGGPGFTARGSRFQLRLRDERVRAAALDGLLRVTLQRETEGDGGEESTEDIVILGPGEQLTSPGGGTAELLRTVDPAAATAWQRGELVFDHQPLYEVVAELNRHRRGRIVILDAALAGREVSGVYRLDSLESAGARLAAGLGASELSLPPFFSLLYRPDAGK